MSMMLRFAICAAAVLGPGSVAQARVKELEGLGYQ